MTQTEILLIILGGIFVIEALSVAIQVFTFKSFRRRVFLMAPLHHHFEMMAWSETKIMIRFWIVAAVLAGIGYTLFQNSIGYLSVSVSPRQGNVLIGRRSIQGCRQSIPRPPLPDGPFLSSGWRARAIAAAEALLARGERVFGTDRGNPPDAGRLAELGVELELDGDGIRPARPRELRGQEPRGARRMLR